MIAQSNINNGVAKTGVPSPSELASCPGMPSIRRMKEGRVSVIECVQEIPCNPCESACPFGAITVGDQITSLPVLHEEKCTGCGACIPGCPGLAIFVVDQSRTDGFAVVEFPFEYLPLPNKGDRVTAVNRAGEALCAAEVLSVKQSKAYNGTTVIGLLVPIAYAGEARGMKRLARRDG